MSTNTPIMGLIKPDYRDPRWDVQINGDMDTIDSLHGFVAPNILKQLEGLTTTPVSVFVYNTANDKDGGLWREYCSNLSWYNEPLNTATRGKTRKSPAVALIAAEANKVTIYDATDPLVPMWMVFTGNDSYAVRSNIAGVAMLNGVMVVSHGAGRGLSVIKFKDDGCFGYNDNFYYTSSLNVSQRNSTWHRIELPVNGIVNTTCNDVAMTQLDNMDVPTIAVATDGGISVINGPAGEGTVVDSAATAAVVGVTFLQSSDLAWAYGSALVRITNDYSYNLFSHTRDYSGSSVPPVWGSATTSLSGIEREAFGHDSGLTLLKENPLEPSKGMVNYITSEYQSGWQVGDSLMATLAETEVGLIGTDVTTELVTNGNFDADVSGWTIANLDSMTWDASEAMRAISSNNQGAWQEIMVEIGKIYEVNVSSTAASTPHRVRVIENSLSGTVLVETEDVSTPTDFAVTFKATTTKTIIYLRNSGPGDILWDNISVKPIQNLVENGEFSSDRAWTPSDGSITISGGTLNLSSTNSNETIINSATPIIHGKQYKVTFEITSVTSGAIRISLGDTRGSEFSTVGIHSEVITGSIEDFIFFQPESGPVTMSVDNVSVELLDVPDRSPKNNPLQVVGQLTREPVATGSELVAYSGFSEDNYIEQPYNSDLDFGTGDFCMMLWLVPGGGITSKTLAVISDEVGYRKVGFIDAGGNVRFYINGVAIFSLIYTLPTDIPILLTAVRDNGVVKVYFNNELKWSGANVDNISLTEETLKVGNDPNGSGPANDAITLFCISGTALSADQIKEIYETEKMLFQEETLCTLQTSTSSVLSLDYDESTDTLYAGGEDGCTEIVGVVCRNCESVEQDTQIDSISVNDGVILSNDVVDYPKTNLRELRAKINAIYSTIS